MSGEIGDLIDYALADVENAIKDQSNSLHNLRVRTSYILTLNGLVLSYFGAGFFKASEVALNLSGWLAVVSSVAATVLCLKILVPISGWLFSHDTSEFLRRFVFTGATVDVLEAKIEIALMRSNHRTENQKKLNLLHSLFFFAGILVFVQIVFWLIGELL